MNILQCTGQAIRGKNYLVLNISVVLRLRNLRKGSGFGMGHVGDKVMVMFIS